MRVVVGWTDIRTQHTKRYSEFSLRFSETRVRDVKGWFADNEIAVDVVII